MRLLILASPFDRVADAVGARVHAIGGLVERRTLEELASATWHHRLGHAGAATELSFADGSSLAGSATDVVLNRLRYEPTLLFTRMTVADRDYARAEFHALLLSWLASLGRRVFGRPAPSGLGGLMLGGWQWLAAAARAGFDPYPAAATTSARRAPPPRGDTAWPALLPGANDPALETLGFNRPRARGPPASGCRRMTVVGDEVVEGDDALAGPALRLARDLATDLLAIDLAQAPHDPRWRFIGATTMPETLAPLALDSLVARIAPPR